MGTTVTSLTGDAVWPTVGDAAGAEGFLGVLGEVAGGVPCATTGILLSPSPAGGDLRQGQVADHPDLTFGYHPDELAVSVGRTGVGGRTLPVASLIRDGAGTLHDASGNRAGQIRPDGSVRLDPEWLNAQGLASGVMTPAPRGATILHSAEGPTDDDAPAEGPGTGATEPTSSTDGPQETDGPEAKVSPDRRNHILEGDETGGGHRAGAKRGKSEFPSDWSDDKIIDELESVANDPGSSRSLQPNGRTRVVGRIGNDGFVVSRRTKQPTLVRFESQSGCSPCAF